MPAIKVLFAAALCLVLSAAALRADDAAQIKEVNAAIQALDAAFEKQDADAIKALTTPDHIAVTPYYDAPQTVAQQLASTKDYQIKQTLVLEPAVTLLGPDVALRTSIATFEGTFAGKPVPKRMFVTEVIVKRDGKWLEAFYQLTALGR